MAKLKKRMDIYFNCFFIMLFLIFTQLFFIDATKVDAQPTVVTNVNDAILLSEMYPNIAFQSFGFDKVDNVSRSNTTFETINDTIRFSADFSFSVDGAIFSGPGNWESTETAGIFSIVLDYELNDGNNTLKFNYASQENLVNNNKTETVNTSYQGKILTIQKYTEVTPTITGKIIQNNGTVNYDGQQYQFSMEINENEISPDTISYTITNEYTPISPAGPTKLVEVEYEVVSVPDESMTASFSKYDVIIGGVLTYTLDTGSTSTHQMLITGENSATENLMMNLLHVTNGNRKIKYNLENPVQLSYIYKLANARNGGGWSWNTFGKVTVSGTVGGGVGAAAGYGVMLLCASPPGLIGTILIGATAAGVAGATGYGVSELWDCIFQENSPPANVEKATFAENDSMTVGQNSQGGSSYPIPTLSEWKQIFLTLIMLSLVMGFMRKTHPKAALSNGGTMLKITDSNFLAFNRHVYSSALKWVSAVAVLGLAGAAVIFGHVSMLDIIGMLFCVPLVAYILHLVISFTNDYQGISE